MQQEGHFVPWQGAWEQIRTKILDSSIIVSRVPVGQKNLKRLVSAIETENFKNLNTASCVSCAFLRSRLESQSWNSLRSNVNKGFIRFQIYIYIYCIYTGIL